MEYVVGLVFEDQGLAAGVDRATQSFGAVGDAADEAQEGIDRASKTTKDYGSSSEKAAKSTDRAAKSSKSYADGTGKAARGARDAAGATDRWAKSSEGMNRVLKTQIRDLAALALGYLGVREAVQQVGESVRVFRDFQDTQAGVLAVSRATREEWGRLKQQAIDLGASTIFSATEASEAQENLARAGFSVAENLTALPGILDLAASSSEGLATSADIGAGVLRGFRLEASQMAEVVDILATSTNIANTDVTEMGEALKFAAPTAASLNIDLRDTTAAMAVLADNMLRGSMGGTGFRQAMLGIIDPSGKAETVLTDLGISAETFRSTLEDQGLVAALELLIDKSNGITEAVQLAGARGGTALQILLTNLDELSEKGAALDDVSGSAERMADIRMDTLTGDLDEMDAAIENLRLGFVEGMEPAIRAFSVTLKQSFENNQGSVEDFGKTVGELIGLLDSLVQNMDKVVMATTLVVTAFAAWKLEAQILAVANYATAFVALAATEGLVAVATAELSLAWASLNSVMLLNPVVLGATAMVGGFLLVKNVLSDFADSSTEDTERIVESAKGIREEWETTTLAIESGSLRMMEAQERGLSTAVDAARVRLVEIQRDLAQETSKFQRDTGQEVDLSLGRGTEEIMRLTEAMEDQQAVVAALGAQHAQLGANIDDAFQGMLDRFDLSEFLKQQEEVPPKIDEATQKFMDLRDELLGNVSSLNELSDAYLRNDGSAQQVLQSMELQNAIRGVSINLTEQQRGVIEGLIATQLEAERRAAGSESISALQDQLDGLRDINAAYALSAAAADQVRQKLDAEAKARKLVEGAAEGQERAIRDLLSAIQREEAEQAFQETAAAIEEEIDALVRLAEARSDGVLEGLRMEDQLKREKELFDLTKPLIDAQAQALQQLAGAEAELAQIKSGAIDAADERAAALEEEIDEIGRFLDLTDQEIAKLKELVTVREALAGADAGASILADNQARLDQQAAEVDLLERLSALRKEDFATLAEYEDARRQVETEHEVYLSNLEHEAMLKEVLAERTRGISDEDERYADILAQATAEVESQADAAEVLIRKRRELEATADSGNPKLERTVEIMYGIADVFGEIDSGLGDLIGTIAEATDAWRRYSEAKASDDQAGMDAAVGDMYNAAGSYLGGALAGGGTSGFGGELAGTYSAEGAELGSYFGGYWAAVGAVVGAMFKKSGDEAAVAVEQFGDRVQASVRYAEGGLGDAADDLVGGFNQFMAQIQSEFGIAINNLGGLEFKFTERGILEVSGDQIGTAGFRDLSSAAAYAAEQLLSLNAETNSLGENMQALLTTMGGHAEFESLEQLYAALRLAAEADGQIMGEQLLIMQQITEQRHLDMEMANQLGLSYEMVLAVTDQRIQALRDEVEAMRLSAFGVQDFVTQTLQVVQAMESYNAGLDAEKKSRARSLAELEAMSAGLQEVADEAAAGLADLRGGGGGGGMRDVFHDAADAMGGASRAATGLGASAGNAADALESGRRSMEGSIGAATGMADAFEASKKGRFEERREMFESIDAAKRNAEAIEALKNSMSEIPEAFSPKDIADVWTDAAADAGLAIIGILRQIHGDGYAAGEERMLQNKLIQLQLAAQISSVYALLDATDALDQATRAVLEGILISAEETLHGLASGRLSIRTSGGGGGRDTGRQQRAQARDDARDRIADLELRLSGMSSQALAAVNAMSELADRLGEVAKAGLSAAETERLRRLELEALTDDFMSRVRARGDQTSPLEASATAYGGILEEARILAEATAREYGTSWQSEMLGMLPEIEAAFASEIGGALSDAIGGAQTAADLANVADSLAALRDADLPPGVRELIDSLPDLSKEMAVAIKRIAESVMDSLQEYTDAVLGIGDTERALLDMQQRFAEARQELLDLQDVASGESVSESAEGMRDSILLALSEVGDQAAAILAEAFGDLAPEIFLPDEGDQAPPIEPQILATPQSVAQASSELAEMSDEIAGLRSEAGRSGGAVHALAEDLDLLDAALVRATHQLAYDFLGSLEQLGVSLPVEVVREMAEAQFALAQAEAISAAIALAAAGGFDELSLSLEDLINLIENADFDSSAFALPTPQGGGGGIFGDDPAQPLDNYLDILARIQDGIDAWMNLDTGPATQSARQMLDDLDSLHELLEQTLTVGSGQAIGDYEDTLAAIGEAFEFAVGVFAGNALDQLAGRNQGLLSDYEDLVFQIDDVRNAFEELGIMSEYAEDFAQASSEALQNFFDEATSGVQDLIDRLTIGPESGRAPEDLLAEQQVLVQDLADRVLSGDLDALEDFDTEAGTLLDLIEDIYGSGRAGGILRDQILELLTSVREADFADIIGTVEPGDGPLGGGLPDLPGDRGDGLVVQAHDLIERPLTPEELLSGVIDRSTTVRGGGFNSTPIFDRIGMRGGLSRPVRATELPYEATVSDVIRYDRDSSREAADTISRTMRQEVRRLSETMTTQWDRDRRIRTEYADDRAEAIRQTFREEMNKRPQNETTRPVDTAR